MIFRRTGRVLVGGLAVLLSLAPVVSAASAATSLTVTTTADVVNGDVSSVANLVANPGPDGISLREAIEATNNDPGTYTIGFSSNLSGTTITLGSDLPALAGGGVTIDGPNVTVARGASFVQTCPLGALQGGPGGDGCGFQIVSSGNSLSGLTISGFGIGVELHPASPGGVMPQHVTLANNSMEGLTIENNVGAAIGFRSFFSAVCGGVQQQRCFTYTTWQNTTISDNTIMGGSEAGIMSNIQDSGDQIDQITISNNTIQAGTDVSNPAIDLGAGGDAIDSNLSNVQITGNTISGHFPDGISIGSGVERSQSDVVSNVQILNNKIQLTCPQLSLCVGVYLPVGNDSAQLALLTSPPRYPDNNQLTDVTVSGNVIGGNPAWGISIAVGQSIGGANNTVSGVNLTNNTIQTSTPTIGIFVFTGNSDNRTTSGNVVSNLTISSNNISTGGNGPGLNQGEVGAGPGAIEILGAGSCASGDSMNGIRITGNSLANPYVGIRILGGAGGSACPTNNTTISNVVVDSNRIALTAEDPNLDNPQNGGIVLLGGFGGATNSTISSVQLTRNVINTNLVGIGIVGGLNGAGSSNTVSNIELTGNTVLHAPLTSVSLLKGINIIGGDNASGNTVSIVTLTDNSVAGASNAFSVSADFAGGASNQVNTPRVISSAMDCVVPKVVGKTLAVAKRLIKTANCSLGKVKESASTGAIGVVIYQTPVQDRKLAKFAKINLVISKGTK